MQILVIYDSESLQIRRFVGPMPVAIEAHVQPGESYYLCDTTIPKHPEEIQAEVLEHARAGGAE